MILAHLARVGHVIRVCVQLLGRSWGATCSHLLPWLFFCDEPTIITRALFYSCKMKGIFIKFGYMQQVVYKAVHALLEKKKKKSIITKSGCLLDICT